MRRIVFGMLMVVLVGVGPARAESVTIVAPVYGQIVAFALPDGFGSAFEHAADGFYIHEFLTEGETLEQWSQMITLTGTEGGARGDAVARVLSFAEVMASRYGDYCPGALVTHQYELDGGVSGEEAGITVYLGCPAGGNGGPGEAMVMVVMAGAEDLYTLQWAKRFDAADMPELLDPESWFAQVGLLMGGARICDPVAGEAPPYPSCTE